MSLWKELITDSIVGGTPYLSETIPLWNRHRPFEVHTEDKQGVFMLSAFSTNYLTVQSYLCIPSPFKTDTETQARPPLPLTAGCLGGLLQTPFTSSSKLIPLQLSHFLRSPFLGMRTVCVRWRGNGDWTPLLRTGWTCCPWFKTIFTVLWSLPL